MRVRLLLLSCLVGAMSLHAQNQENIPTISFPLKSQPEQQVQAATPPMTLKTASTSFILTFEGVGNYSSVNNFYNGGTSSLGTSGTNYGVQFSSNALALVDADDGGSGNFANEPTPSTIIFFISGVPTMNYAAGFSTGLSFFYGTSQDLTVNIYDGLNGTGQLLATASFSSNFYPQGPGDPSGAFANWTIATVPFEGLAKSVVFVGAADYCGFDNITFGSLDPNIPTCDNSVTGMTLRTTTDPQGAWTPVKGDLSSGYNMECAAKAPWYFFDITEMSADIPIKPGVMNPFYLKGTYSSGFWSYWEREGVDAEVTEGWGKLMWDILNGDEPLFYLTLEAGNYRLIDAATYHGPYALKSDFHWPGDLPPAEYQFTGIVLGQDDEELCPVTLKLKLGDNEAPVIANCGDYFDLPLVRSVVRTRYGIGIDYVATLSQSALTGLVTDNCGINAVNVSKTRFTRMDVGENLVYVMAEDNAGNTTECEVYVYVYMPGTTRRSGEIGSDQALNTVGADELSLQLYPNPTTGKVNIFLANLNNPEVSVRLFNSTGGMVFDRKIITDGPVELDLTGKVSGLYLLKVNADGKEFNESVILK